MAEAYIGRNGRSGSGLERAISLSCDATSWSPDAGAVGLGVPVSVWPLGSGLVLSGCLVEAFSQAGDLVVSTIAAEVDALVNVDHRVLVLCPARQVPIVEQVWARASASVRLLLRVEAVTAQNLSTRLVGIAGSVDLLLVDQPSCEGEGFWSAAAHAVRRGGLLAVVCTSADPLVHVSLTAGAEAAGWRYMQHLVATSAAELDTEATAPATRASCPGRVHRRVHRDVFLFAPRDKGVSR